VFSIKARAKPQPNQRLKLTGAAILVFQASTSLQAAPAASSPSKPVGYGWSIHRGEKMNSISVEAEECAAFGRRRQVVESFPGRDTNLGDLKILRALPIKGKRLVGPWCFLDRYGPYKFTEGKPMDVAPHPPSEDGSRLVTDRFQLRISGVTSYSGPER
jgi:hypothetical protein